ncbi:MAG: glycosyltransferase family 4 protein [Bacteroidetes bacterium]|nr:glycosyltransferase family 4 protein [Bacteroidota bacterium]MBI3482302.1 glycosyltransferase family 4 protein [Bacteroidota bacterium]
MRIISVQYVSSSHTDPFQWLKRIDFYTGIFDELAKNHEVHSFYHIDYKGSHEINNVKYHFTGLSGLDLVFPVKFHQQIKKLNPDVILVQGFHHPFQVWLLQKSLKENARFYIHHHAERPLRLYKKFFQRLIDRFVSGYFFVSLQQAEEWITSRQIHDRKKIREVMECSSVYQITDRSLARQVTKVQGKVYLWVGRFDRNKDPLTLAKAFAQFSSEHPEVSLYVIYQQNDLLGEVVEIVKGFNRIFMIGCQNKDQLLQWYNSADFIISTSHYEGSGIAVCEAMSCGCIPILSAISSFKWMTNENIGLSFKAGDTEGLHKALVKSLSIDTEIERRKTIENFQRQLSFKAIASRMSQAFAK